MRVIEDSVKMIAARDGKSNSYLYFFDVGTHSLKVDPISVEYVHKVSPRYRYSPVFHNLTFTAP